MLGSSIQIAKHKKHVDKINRYFITSEPASSVSIDLIPFYNNYTNSNVNSTFSFKLISEWQISNNLYIVRRR